MSGITLHLQRSDLFYFMVCTACGHPIGNEGVSLVAEKNHFVTLYIPPCKRCTVPMGVAQDWGFHE